MMISCGQCTRVPCARGGRGTNCTTSVKMWIRLRGSELRNFADFRIRYSLVCIYIKYVHTEGGEGPKIVQFCGQTTENADEAGGGT